MAAATPPAAVSTDLSSIEFWGIVVAAIAGAIGVGIGIASLIQAIRSSRALDAMADDIGRLTALTEKTATRMPDPNLWFLVNGEPKGGVAASLRAPTKVDATAILTAARKKALMSKPEVPQAGYPYVLASPFSPTKKDVAEYESEVSGYVTKLDANLTRRSEYELDLARLLVLSLRLTNDGAVPLEDPRVVISVPSGLEPRQGVSKPDDLPEVPRYVGGLDRLYRSSTLLDRLHPAESKWRLLSAFRITRADTLELAAEDVQHGGYGDLGDIVLAADGPGDYLLEWKVHADNLDEPKNGTLRLRINPPGQSPPQTLSTLKDVGLADSV